MRISDWSSDCALPICDCYTEQRARAALRNPLGAYFRVNHKDLVAMHAAFAEVGVLYASGAVHEGWIDPPSVAASHGSSSWRWATTPSPSSPQTATGSGCRLPGAMRGVGGA